MKYLLALTLTWYGLTFWGYYYASHAHDNFGAIFPVLIGGAISAVLTLVYVGFAFWNHRFW